MNENEYYKNQIVEMLKEISDLRDLKMIYGFVRAAYREKQKGGTHEEYRGRIERDIKK